MLGMLTDNPKAARLFPQRHRDDSYGKPKVRKTNLNILEFQTGFAIQALAEQLPE